MRYLTCASGSCILEKEGVETLLPIIRLVFSSLDSFYGLVHSPPYLQGKVRIENTATPMTFHEHQEVEAIETVFVPKETREARHELNLLAAYGF